jgi:hypothetical protein
MDSAIGLTVRSGFACRSHPYKLCQGASEDADEVLGVAGETGMASREVDQRRAEAFSQRDSSALGELALGGGNRTETNARIAKSSSGRRPGGRAPAEGPTAHRRRYPLATCLKMRFARRTDDSVGREPQHALPDLKTSLLPEVDVEATARLEVLRNLGALIGAELY